MLNKIGTPEMFVVKLNFDYKEERLQAAIARNLAITFEMLFSTFIAC